MASVAQLIAGLESRGIILSVAQGEIRYRGPKGALADEDRQRLKARRDEILDFLQARAAGRALRAITPRQGPLTPSVAQEMWLQFGGGPDQGQPISLNLGMAGNFPGADPAKLADAIRTIVARHDTLRSRAVMTDGALSFVLNDAAGLEIPLWDVSALPFAQAWQQAFDYCNYPILVEGEWLMRAGVFVMPGGMSMAAVSACHIISDAASRGILMNEIQLLLDGQALPDFVPYNDFALAERDFLAGPQGAGLIDYWRRWYHAQPAMHAPSNRRLMQWGNGIRIVRNFRIPKRVHRAVQARAGELVSTPFLVYLGIFALAMARWSGMTRFPVRVLGDKRGNLDLQHTIGLMFCGDAMEIEIPPDADFAAIQKILLVEYEAALVTRLPGLHFWAPHCVRPGIEVVDYPNRIPAVFNYYGGAAASPHAERATADPGSWPPAIDTLSPQLWTRRSAPVFLHLVGEDDALNCSLHFLEDAVPPDDQESFVAIFFQVFAEQVPV